MKNFNHMLFFGIGAAFLSLIFLTKNKIDQEKQAASPCEKSQSQSELLISPEKAKAIACNRLKNTQTGVELFHPNHHVSFEKQGVLFVPKKGPEWGWKLESIGTQEKPLKEIPLQSIKPEIKTAQIVEYRYGDIIEEYHTKANTVEQRFVLEKPLDLDGEDLVIRGRVACEGEFEQLEEGWAWKDHRGQVDLGDVTVFDAQGKTLLAHMNVTAHQTEIVVDAKSLAQAAYPVTVDPEIGANDFRISDMGIFDGDPLYNAFDPEVAYNSVDNEYLVVWSGDDDMSNLLDQEFEIYGQRIDAFTGDEIGVNDFRISDMGAGGMPAFDAINPDVVYNSKNNEYLVVWQGDDNTGLLINSEFEIFGQRLSSNGIEVGVNDFRISDMGSSGNTLFFAGDPAVTYNSKDNEYFVVWEGTDNVPPLVQGESEIFGQRLDGATGSEVGLNDFRISDMGPNADTSFFATEVAVAYNSVDNQYLVIWRGSDNIFPLVQSESEIFGQRLDAATGFEVGNNDFRISDMGPDGDINFAALFNPAVAYNSVDNQYLVVWTGDDNVASLVDEEFEIFGQRLDGATGAEVGTNDFRISDMGPNGVPAFGVDPSFGASDPEVSYNPINNEYLIVWRGEDDVPPLVDDELEIFGQRLDGATGSEVGENDFRISDMGPNGATGFFPDRPAVIGNSTNNESLIVWSSNSDLPNLSSNEVEIYGQRFTTDTLGSNVDKLSLASGGTQNLFLDFGSEFAGKNFLILGSLIGTSPGTPVGNKIIPLNIDAYFLSTLNNPNGPNSTLPNGFGVLDANGQATVQFVLPPGLTLPIGINEVNHVAIIVDAQPSLLKISAISNPEPCTLE